jgi:predicted N-acetyltransferase YhbS
MAARRSVYRLERMSSACKDADATPSHVVRLFEEDDAPGVVTLLNTAFGEWPHGIESLDAAEFFRWKHTESPFGQSLRAVAVADQRIVGFAALMPWRLRIGDRPISAMRGGDIAVDPSYQRRGLSLSLINELAAMRERVAPGVYDFVWTNPNALSLSRTIEGGYRGAGEQPRYMRLHVPTRLRESLRRAARRAARAVQPLGELPTAREALAGDVDPRLLSAPARDRHPRLETVKDLDYLRWRYGALAEYHAVRVKRGEELAIFRAREIGGYRMIEVCELLIERGDLRAARRLLREVKRVCGADLIACSFDSSYFAAACGFVRSPGGAALTIRPLRDDLSPDPTDHRSWALSLGDLELI